MRKGLVLTVDALLAVLILGVFLAIISVETVLPSETPYLFKTSADFLTVLDKGGIIKNMSAQTEAQAEDTLEYYMSTLPRNIGGNVTIVLHEYNGGSFPITRTTSVQVGTKKDDVVALRRLYAFINENEEEEFGLIKMEIWYE